MATVITNNQPRLCLNWNQLTEKEREGFDYAKGREAELDFVRYKGEVYDLAEFMNVTFSNDWDGVHQDTYFSGILFKFDRNDPEYVIMGRYYS